MGKLAAPISELLARLEYHSADVEGRLLRGWKITTDGKKHVEGVDDFPAAFMSIAEVAEAYAPNRNGIGIPGMAVSFQVSGDHNDTLVEFMEQVELFMDALDTREDGRIDPGLSGTLQKPWDMQVREIFPTELSRSADVVLTLQPRAFNRGQRRTT